MLFKLTFFELYCAKIECVEPGTSRLVSHEHFKRIGSCQFDKLDYITYDATTLQTMCLAPLAANLSIMNVNNTRRKCDASKFNRNCPFLKGFGLYLREDGLVRPDDEFPNIYSELLEAFISAVRGSHLKVVTMESDVYVYTSVSDQNLFIGNIRNLHRRLTDRIVRITRVSMSHPKKSLRDASIGDTLELLTMRLRQRQCAICHDDTDDVLSDRRIVCLPCSHLYHEDCIMPYLMKKSSCPLCRYRISVDEVECKLPCDWPRQHRRSRPNFCKILERLAYRIQGSCLGDVLWLLYPAIIRKALVYAF